MVGCNGSGKSTLLRLLAGFLNPDGGEIALDGKPLTAWDRRDLAREMAIVAQDTDGDLPFTAAEVAMMGRIPYAASRQEDEAKVESALQAADVLDLAGRPFQQLSGGERQLVLIARTLAQDPRYLLLDEPTNHLDVYHQHALLTLLRNERGRGVLIVLHDLNLAARYCDEIAVLDGGRVCAMGSPQEVLTPALVERVFRVHAEVARDGAAVQLLLSAAR